jgi:hypothetical protein
MRKLLRLLFGGKRALVVAPLLLAAGFVGFQAARFRLLYYNVSTGTRTGVVRKLSWKRSEKGAPFCRYVSVEMVMNATRAGNVSEIWHFTVDDEDPNGAVVKKLRDAEKAGATVTVDYRQDLHRWWSCPETEYYVTTVE